VKRVWQKFNGKLGMVKDNFFCIVGSPFFYVPQNKRLLEVLKGKYSGVPVKVFGYKMSKGSKFISVGKVSVDRYKQQARAQTRRIKAHAEMDRLTLEKQTQRRHINGGGRHTGFSAKGGYE